MESKEHIVN